MNTLLSILTFPLFFVLLLYYHLLDKLVQPLYAKFMNFLCRFNPNIKVMLFFGDFFVYLEKTKAVSFEIIVMNKDLWVVWFDFFDSIL